MNWISVKDRLPERGTLSEDGKQSILCFENDGTVHANCWYCLGEFIKAGDAEYCRGDVIDTTETLYNITHWMIIEEPKE